MQITEIRNFLSKTILNQNHIRRVRNKKACLISSKVLPAHVKRKETQVHLMFAKHCLVKHLLVHSDLTWV